jgi:hypothetical protein
MTDYDPDDAAILSPPWTTVELVRFRLEELDCLYEYGVLKSGN